VDLITERDGNTHEFFMYNPWGEEMHQWNANTYAFTSPYRFNAKELDPETGLAYYGARYYQNKIGVWLSVDPLAMDTKQVGITSYGFGWNNPLSFVDPTGLMPEAAELGGLALPDQVKAKSASAPIIYVTFRDLPNGMDKESFMISLRQNLISNGVSENLVVKDSKDKGFFEGISNWINEVPTASLLIKKYNIRSDGHPEKGGYAIPHDPNSPIIFTGLSPNRSDQFLSENQYVRAAMHELGHGIWGLPHNKDGKAPDPNSCMDYKYSGLNYSEDEKKKIRASAWGN
jgi:RHS repeat-associated protein